MSNSKSVYVLSKGHLRLFQKLGMGSCNKCLKQFNVKDIVAKSTTKHYCYSCAIQINLVTGNMQTDLNNHKFIPEVLYYIQHISQKNSLPSNITQFSQVIIKIAFENSYHVSNNKLALACAAIFLTCQIKELTHFNFDNIFPITKKTLQANLFLLQKSLENVDVSDISQKIHGMI